MIKGCKNMSLLLWNWCSLIYTTLIIILISLYGLLRVEGFGSTSPGTLVQLQTSHVPTEDDEYYYKYIYPKLVRREIYEMTIGDV